MKGLKTMTSDSSNKQNEKAYWTKFYSEQVGQNYTTVTRNTQDQWLFNLIKAEGDNICANLTCGKEIENMEDLSFAWRIHFSTTEDPKEQEDLFYDEKNICFMHRRCSQSISGSKNNKKNNLTGIGKYTNENGGIRYRPRMSFSNSKPIQLINTDNEILAAETFDLATLKYHDGKGKINFPEKIEEYKQKINDGWKIDKVEEFLERNK